MNYRKLCRFFFTVKRGFSHFLDRRRQKPPVNTDVRAGDEAAGRVRREEHRRAEQPYLAARCDCNYAPRDVPSLRINSI